MDIFGDFFSFLNYMDLNLFTFGIIMLILGSLVIYGNLSVGMGYYRIPDKNERLGLIMGLITAITGLITALASLIMAIKSK